MSNQSKLDSIESAIKDIQEGKIVIVVDDEDRENEGDFICSAQTITPEKINFMATYGRGLICTPLLEHKAKELRLTRMVSDNTALHETAFTVSIDYLKQGCSTGISAYDRATGIKELVNPETKYSDYARPGHIFPLIAKDGGVLRRTGHTEAAVDLARMAGHYPAGVLVEILNEDGSMARLPDLEVIAKKHGLKLISIKDLVEYRLNNETLVNVVYKTELETQYGRFNVTAYSDLHSEDVHLALHKGLEESDKPCLVRVHSVAASGGALGFIFEDYAQRIAKALRMIEAEGRGTVILMQQGEEGESILNKLKQMDTDKTNDVLNPHIHKDFGLGAQILRDLGVRKIKLITSNPKKQVALDGYGLEIVDYINL